MDSFFDFDTSLPPADELDGSRPKRRNADSEDEYDALNDETFGDPDKGDWENMHETLVRLEKGPECLLNDDRHGDVLFDDDELDLHLSRFDFGDGDESIGSTTDLSLDDDIGSRLRLDPSIWGSPAKKQQAQEMPVNHGMQNLFPTLPIVQNGFENSFRPRSYPVPQVPIKMLSVEDIERNIIQQQRQQLQQQEHQEQLKKEREQLQLQQQKVLQENHKNKTARKVMVPLVTPALQPIVPAAQLLAIRNQMFPHPQLLSHPQTRMPLGFLPYNFLPAPFSTPINNLAMHPGFPAAAQLGMFPHQRIPLPIQPNLVPNLQNNQFNKRLVQEIQQNHPLLSFNRQIYQQNCNNNNNNGQKRYYNAAPKGPDYDEYSNLMSNREKQWLIGIQLTQLNSDAPYINDYYFTVYKERLAARNGTRESRAYKDNQLNHPFTQPTGHAQLLLMSSLAKNCGMLNAKGGLLNRERHNSESKNNNGADQKDQQPARTYTPLQFENSLGKLQCGSVTAPRKIIDMDVVGAEPTQGGTTTRELLHRLLHIETLYKVVLKMEDQNNPVAIEAALMAREKREKEQQVLDVDSTNTSLSSSAESFDELLTVLIVGLAQDKVIPMLGVRKGKILLRRILVLLRDHPYRWSLWTTIFSTIPFMLKKDRDDPEGVLFALYTEFERHVQYSQFVDLLKLSQILSTEKILSHLITCKFLLSSVITIIFQMEIFFVKAPDVPNLAKELQWIGFLETVTSVVSKPLVPPQQMIKLDRGNNIVRTIRAHLDRFPQQVKGNGFVDFITVDSPAGKGGKPN